MTGDATPATESSVGQASAVHKPTTQNNMFDVPVDDFNKCIEFKPFKGGLPHCGRQRKRNPHMRGFWGATMAFHVAFIGWFAFAPLLTVVRKDIGICDNNDEVQLDIENTKCICVDHCKDVLDNAKIASISFDIFMRFMLGFVLERFGPVNTDCLLLVVGGVFVGLGSTVSNGVGLIVIRFFVSMVGATFVTNQFWNSILFAPSVKGTANGTAGGWGNLGGGVTQIVMPLVYLFFHDVLDLPLSLAWRFSMLVPAILFFMTAIWIKFCTQDTPVGKFDITMLGKTDAAGIKTYIRCLQDYRVFLMIFQYGACFGAELVMHNALHSHFHDYFGVGNAASGFLASCFGFMNLFARSSGGILADWAGTRFGMTGHLWSHFLSLFFAAVSLFVFGCMNVECGPYAAAIVIAIFSVFTNMAEGTSYAIVPYMMPADIAVVSSLVGAGGTLGAVIATSLFYKPVKDPLLPFQLHAGYMLFWAFTVPLMGWTHMGSMFRLVPATIEGVKTVERKLEDGAARAEVANTSEKELNDGVAI